LIKKDIKSGMTNVEISEKYNTTTDTVCHIRIGQIWKNVN
jgi:hypothetical protein